MAPVIVAHDLHKRYAGFAPVLRGVNIEVEPGELVAIMGPSGCGKSTMLHVLGMLHAPDSGTLEILGNNVLFFNREQTAAFRRGNLGFVMQQSNLFDHSTVFENVEFPLIYEKVPPQERWPRVIRALELVRLSSRVHYPSNRLSGGEQQRVAIARAMVNSPRILMADEPTGALDQRTSRLVMENFRNLCHAGGVAMVMVTHDVKMADFCDTVYTLEEGVLVCHKREVPKIDPHGVTHLLDGPELRLATALVSESFLEGEAESVRAEAHILHSAGLLSQVATLTGGTFLGKEMQNYSMPMPVQQMGGVHGMSSLGAYLGVCGGVKSKDDTVWQRFSQIAPLAGSVSRRWMAAQAKTLARWGVANGVQCLYAAGGRRPCVLTWTASRLSGIPFAFVARETDGWADSLEQESMQKALNEVVTDASFVRCASPHVADILKKVVGESLADRISFVPDAPTLMPMDEELAAARNHEQHLGVRLLCAGTLHARKGYDVLLRALGKIKAQGQSFRLTIAGTGPEADSLKKLAKDVGISDDVWFAGFVPHENLSTLYLENDIFISCGVRRKGLAGDGIPSALTEAMAWCLPVIASDLEGQKWLVKDGRCGFLVEQDSEESLVRGLERLIGLPDAWKAMGLACHERVRELLDDDGKGLCGLFDGIIAHRNDFEAAGLL